MTIGKFCQETGLTEAAVRNHIATGRLRKDSHYHQRVRRGRILLDYDLVLKELS